MKWHHLTEKQSNDLFRAAMLVWLLFLSLENHSLKTKLQQNVSNHVVPAFVKR